MIFSSLCRIIYILRKKNTPFFFQGLFSMGTFNSKFYNILSALLISVTTFDWIELQKWSTLLAKIKKLL